MKEAKKVTDRGRGPPSDGLVLCLTLTSQTFPGESSLLPLPMFLERGVVRSRGKEEGDLLDPALVQIITTGVNIVIIGGRV